MKKFLMISLIIGLFMLSSIFAVAGEGFVNIALSKTKEISPDMAEITIKVETSNKSAQVAADENKKISTNVQNKIKTFIDNNNGDYIITTNYNLSSKNQYLNGKTIFDKYVADNTIKIYTKNLDNISKLIDTATKEGATSVSNLNFKSTDYDELCTEMLTELVSKSKEKAIKMTKPAGVNITGIKSLDTTCSTENNNIFNGRLYAAKSTGSLDNLSTPIEQGKIKVTARIDVSYYLK